MNPNNDFDKIFEEIVDECLEENNEEETQQQSYNSTSRRRKRRTVIDRNREEGNTQLCNDYFSENPIYTDAQFRRRFRMRRHVFLRIVDALGNHDDYLSPADIVDDYVRIGESTKLECLDNFVMGICKIFGAQYLRRPNNEDLVRLLQIGEARGFSGSNNDINVLNTLDVFNYVLNGQAPAVQYTVNITAYHMGYYLDDIYPEWATFVKTIPMPQGEKSKLFSQRQESTRKDIERAFGVLHSRFAIIRGPARA